MLFRSNIDGVHRNVNGTFDAITSHTSYITDPVIINTIKNIIAK